ncbi:hypothetical protein [Gorillibacterium sp. sgz5001074]|uniref:hypothetical protein n=1 Tax=Gorillibacterium sp. sgz5001074 TaxID=3446695 RepID=UPI003F679F81
MNWLSIVITVFVIGGILYNFAESAEENGLDFFGGIYKILRMTFLLLAFPFLLILDRMKKH